MESPRRSRSPPVPPPKLPSEPRPHRHSKKKRSPGSPELTAQEHGASLKRKPRSKARTTELGGTNVSKQPEGTTAEQAPPSTAVSSKSTGLTTEQAPTSSGPPASIEVTSADLHSGPSAALPPALPKTTASSQQVTATQPTLGTASMPRRGSRQLRDGPFRPITAHIANPPPGPGRGGGRSSAESTPEHSPARNVLAPRSSVPALGKAEISNASSASRHPGIGTTAKTALPVQALESTPTSKIQVRSYRREAALALAGLAITAFFCALVYALFPKPRAAASVMDELLCRTEDCRHQAEIVNRYLNTSVDPCADFDAYVCSKWNHQHATRKGDPRSIMDFGFKLWVNDFEKNLMRAVPHHPMAIQVLEVFTSCMADSSPAKSLSDVALLRVFMSDIRVPWPELAPEGVDPLEVAIDLSVNWRLGLWFDVTPLRHPDGTAFVIMRPARLYRLWFPIEREVAASGAHRALWDGLYTALAPNQEPRPDSEILSVVQTHSAIYKELSLAVGENQTTPLRFTLREISARMPNVSAARWMQALKPSTGLSFDLTDAVTFADKTLLNAMNNIFSRHNSTAMKRDLSWTFVQVFASIANRNFLTYTLGTHSMALERRRAFCATEVEAAYRWLVVSLRVIVDFPPERRDAVDASLNEVTQAVVSKLNSLSWGEPGFRRSLTDKVLNVSVTLWPDGSLLTSKGLSDFYAGWFPNASSFTRHWITAARKWRELNVHAGLSQHPRNFLHPFIRYDYFLNAVRVTLVALHAPFHYANGTKAMRYGSLGFFYALQLVRSFDAIALQVDPEGRVSESWLPAGTRNVTAKKASCLGSGRCYNDYFPEIPAIEAAHAAFEAALVDLDRSQVVVSVFNEHQLFFFAACFMFCGLHGENEAALRLSCNKAVANFPPFAKAFRCRDNVAMNPPNKCPFY